MPDEQARSNHTAGGPKRGRKSSRPDPGDGPVARLADQLWELKEQAGNPSYIQMCGQLGAAASKSSLAAAARGKTLPSWETTWEFVRVLAVVSLGENEQRARALWRERWERARDESAPDQRQPHPPELSIVDPDSTPSSCERSNPPEQRVPERSPRRFNGSLLLATAVAVAAIVVAAAVIRTPPNSSGSAGQSQPPALSPGDNSSLAGENHKDGSTVPAGREFTKIWKIQNLGSMHWEKRYLVRIDEMPCPAPRRVPVPATGPGEVATIAATVRATDQPTRCKSHWRIANEEGNNLLEGKIPVRLDVTIAA